VKKQQNAFYARDEVAVVNRSRSHVGKRLRNRISKKKSQEKKPHEGFFKTLKKNPSRKKALMKDFRKIPHEKILENRSKLTKIP
jgi:hypothetical protein